MATICIPFTCLLFLLLNNNITLSLAATHFNSTTDHQALLAFKNSIIISNPNDALARNWSSDVSVCSWIGVSCGVKHERVTELNMTGFNRSGTLPPHLGNLTFLKFFDISSNNFTGNIPSEMSKLRRLKVFDVAFNKFTGEIPSWFGVMPELLYIILNNNSFSGGIPPQIGNITSLFYLHLATNFLTGQIPEVVGNITSLAHLYLYENNFTGEIPQELANLQNLVGLSVRDNSFYGPIPSFIFNISTLELLTLSFNNFSATLPSNMGLSLFNLKELYLSHNSLTGTIPNSITNASKLTSLEMNANSFSGTIPNFGNLKLLLNLRLWGNNLTGAESPTQELGFLSSLTNCRFLEVFDISNNPLNGVLPSSIGNFSSSLYSLALYMSNIYGVIPPEIGNLSGLLQITISRNQLTGSLPSTFGQLQKLQRFYAHNNQLQGYIPRDLCQLSNLAELNLSSNELVGPIPECLGELQYMTFLFLSSNNLNSTLPANFWNLRYLVRLDLSLNNLSGELSSRVGNLEGVTMLDLSYNQFSGEIPSLIDGCKSLLFLYLSDNNFSGSIPKSLGNIRGLEKLDLSCNNLSGLIPESLQDLQVLRYFDVSDNRLEGDIPNGGPFVNLTSQSFAQNYGLCGSSRFGVPPCPKNQRGFRKNIMLLKYVLPSLILAIVMVVVAMLLLIRRRVKKNVPPPPENLLGVSWRTISYIELQRGTGSFSETNLLGRGCFGSVYKAVLSDGLNLAVKVFDLELEGASNSFDSESEILSALRHRNLVRIIGCCVNAEFRALILEYMPNGSLEKWLRSDNYCLDMLQSLQIAIDVALALEYLHHGHPFPVVHCDIKPSNVLLDNDMMARVGDFGISKLFDEGETMVQTQTIATIGYAAPEYGSEGTVSTKGDVYSYGILLLEIFTGKKPTDDMFDEELSLKEWVCEAIQENAIAEIVTSGLLSRDDQDFSDMEICVSSIFEVAMKCLAFEPEERTNMAQVVAYLHKIKAKVTTQGVNNSHYRH